MQLLGTVAQEAVPLIAIAFVALLLTWRHSQRKRAGASKGGGVPAGSPPPVMTTRVPIVGGLLAFLSDPLTAVERGYKEHGDCFTIRAAHKRLTFLLGPDAHQTFFRGTGERYCCGFRACIRADVGAVWRARALCLPRITHAPMLHWPDAIFVVPHTCLSSPLTSPRNHRAAQT